MDISVKASPSYQMATAAANIYKDEATDKAQAPNRQASQQDAPKSEAELHSAVQDIQDFVQSLQRNLEFSVDDSTGTWVVKVVARDSGEVIRQIPSETALELARSLQDVNSLLFDAKA
ncbi:MAG TPA: flagellar biosynthesis protein FlaG [Pseudomonas sp.]|uniref:flagellar protein FlaG n=1 Tax=unclassified Pseudomonas TaxID=196821 RepID=UPI000EC175DD|nr:MULTISPECIES: flagellar protein FlaG [unclassified Pseudomonas]HAB01622.1 flagellar biosynthesis protein FlaG [Pseudomonas sp.]